MAGIVAGCGVIEITGSVDANLAEETYSVDARSMDTEYIPDVTVDVHTDVLTPYAPIPSCGDCMATSCADCLRWCVGGCIEVDELNCMECGDECADGWACQGRDIGGICVFGCTE